MHVRPAAVFASMLGFGLLLAACSSHETRPSQSSTSSQKAASSASNAPSSAHATHRASSRTHGKSGSSPKLPDKTGIPACDDYLASYKACHRAAHIFPADTIESHYQTMRNTLLEQSRDPEQRKILPARCRSLNKLMRQALHGKSCEAPASAASNAPSESSS